MNAPTRRRRLSGTALALAALLALAAPARSEVRWVLATEYPESTVSGAGLAMLAERVAARTGGAVVIAPAFDNAAKATSGEMIRAAQEGRITGGDAFAGPLEAIDPVFGLPSLPFLVRSVEAARDLNARARPLYEAVLARRGLKLLYVTIWPPTGLWSNRALSGPDALAGLILRTYDETSAAVMRAAGAEAVFLPFSETIARVKAGTLSGILTSGDGGAGRRLWDDLHHFTAITYAVPISVAFIRRDAFDALPPEQQAAVTEAAAETERRQVERLATRTEENYARMRRNGVAIADPAPAPLLAALTRAAAPAIAAWKRRVPPEAAGLADGAGGP